MVGNPVQGYHSGAPLTSYQSVTSSTGESLPRLALAPTDYPVTLFQRYIECDSKERAADMEKEPQPESMATVTIKPEYTPSEYSASEPPPAYMKPRSSSVQIAKIIAGTVIACSLILGVFLLASAYVSANASCRQLEQELEILSEAADRFQGPLQPEALIQEPTATTSNAKRQVDPLHAEEPTSSTKELTNHVDDDSSEGDSDESDSDSEEVPNREPLRPSKAAAASPMDMDELISHLLEKNQKSKMNCVVEKKKAEEFVDHLPKTVRLPFGINLTTNPRFEKLTGERMVIVCESGTLQSAEPSVKPKEEDPEDQDEETIMIQPLMIPIPHSPFNTHMPQQMAPPMQQRPMGPQMIHIENLRPPMPPTMPQQDQQMSGQPEFQIHMEAQQVPQRQPNDFPPNPILQHIVQQIVAQKIIESQKLREQQMKEQEQQQQREITPQAPVQQDQTSESEERPRFVQIEQMGQAGQKLPIPEEVLAQLHRLPLPLPNRVAIVAMSEGDSEESTPQDVQFVQEQRQSANEMNGRQMYARGIPLSLPVGVTPQEAEPQEQDKQGNEVRPHYVQPRSVSV
ncbi:unnamed protein product [Phyllotreta striolata]|uniref:Uncharacterized protein n=1 Tax=Phyllotreta striolata TaxID=444603 RepID=A0A9N9TQM4_PHYSR|nr:unnamed protein product [Phyllotreta striolata]